FDGQSARACIDATAFASCLLDSDVLRRPAPCQTAYRGTVHDGDACALDAECISQRCTVPACDNACCIGRCTGDQPPGSALVGDACSLDDNCRVGLSCQTGKCAPERLAGEPCESQSACAGGLRCFAGACTALPKRGEPCPQQACGEIETLCLGASPTC